MNYGYIRVSTDAQTTRNQRYEILRFCKADGLPVDGWIQEIISGTRDYGKRALGRLLRRVKKGDIIICTELSRLGRSLYMIMEILNLCMKKECRLYTVKEGYRLGDDIPSKVLAFAFGLSAEIERQLISQRTREALSRRRAEGMVLGRPAGRGQVVTVLEGKADEVQRLLAAGVPKTDIARRLGVSRGTLYRWLKGRG